MNMPPTPTTKILKINLTLLLLACLPLTGMARALDWGSSVLGKNYQEDAVSPLSDSYVFYLGVFDNFTPTKDNLTEWSDHWISVDATNYRFEASFFGARHILTDEDPTPGTRGYIWGVRRDRQLNEWILISDPSWEWPPNELLGLKVSWLVSKATEVIVGEINGDDFQMLTEDVGSAKIPTMSYDIWVKRFYADGEDQSIGAITSDSNNNGVPNLMEYALDHNPVSTKSAAKPPQVILYDEPSDGLQYLAIIIEPSVDADFDVNGILSNTPDFTGDVESAIVETLTDGSIVIRDSQPIQTSSKFLRVDFSTE